MVLRRVLRHFAQARVTKVTDAFARNFSLEVTRPSAAEMVALAEILPRGTPVYFSAVPLDDKASNFPKNSVFVPVLYKIAILSVPLVPLFYALSADNGIVIENDSLKNKEVYRIRKVDSDFESIPETRSSGSITRLYPHEQIREAGLYTVMEGSRVAQGIAFNYDRRESDLRCYTGDEVNAMLKRSDVKYFEVLKAKQVSLAKQIRDINQGIPLWKYFVLGALAFLLAEIVLIKIR